MFIHFPMHIPNLRINPFSQCMEEKLELLPELLTLADLSKETTSEEASEQGDPGASEDKDMSDFATCSR